MPVVAKILPKANLVYARYSGTVLLDEIRAEMARTFGDPAYHPSMNEIGDLRQTEEIDLRFPQMLAHANAVVALNERSKTRKSLLLVADSSLRYGMARMFQSLAERDGANLQVHVVTTLTEAERILGLDPLGF